MKAAKLSQEVFLFLFISGNSFISLYFSEAQMPELKCLLFPEPSEISQVQS